MAGGRGKRLRPVTDTVPEPMLHVNGRPIIETIISKLRAQGFRNFYLVVNYLKGQIMSHLEMEKILV